MWIQFLYFLKLFTKTAFYSSLVYKTFSDISYFLIIFAIILFPFANAIYILNDKRDLKDENATLYANAFGENAEEMSAVLNQYILALGEYATDNFDYGEGEDAPVLWLFFMVSTFLTSVIMLNMMIAIMGETFN